MKHLLVVPLEEACRIVLQVTRRGTQAELEAASLPARVAWLDATTGIAYPAEYTLSNLRRVLVVDYPEEAS